MAIGGHIGDMELTAGGLLATASLKGYKIVTVALTAGEKGNPPGMSAADYRVQKEREAADFARRLNGEAVVFPYADGELPTDDTVKFALCDEIRKYKPKFLITHWKNSMHKDHEAAYMITKDAQFYAGLPGFERELPPHYAGGPFYAENWEDPTGFTPYQYFEVTPEGFALWEDAINIHWFALNSKSFRYKDYYAALKKMRGCLNRMDYAEAYDIEGLSKCARASL
jgi:LmbE family N-acetylglucosaminyl deacetylase